MKEHHRAHHQAEQDGRLPMWCIYDHPRDYPAHYAARLFLTLPGPEPEPTEYVLLHRDLNGLRDMKPPTCTTLARRDEDEPHIVEVWL